jgi:hypothetical protein
LRKTLFRENAGNNTAADCLFAPTGEQFAAPLELLTRRQVFPPEEYERR